MATKKYWRVRVDSSTLNHAYFYTIRLRGTLGGANLAVHPSTGTGSSSSTNNGSSLWAWDQQGNGGWTSALNPTYPQWTQFEFPVATSVVQADLYNGPGVLSTSGFIQSSDDGITWANEAPFTTASPANSITSVYFGPIEHATAEIQLPALTSFGTGDGAVALPALSLSSSCGGVAAGTLPKPFVSNTKRGHNVALPSLPSLAVAVSGGVNSAQTLPVLNASAYGHDALGERDAQITLPSLSVAAVVGGHSRATLPSLTAEATGTVPAILTSDIPLPSLAVALDGRTAAVTRAEPLLPALTASGYSGAVCSVSIGNLTLSASGTTGRVGTVQATLPLFVAVATGIIGNTASADITLPSLTVSTGVRAPITLPSLSFVAIGTAVVAVTYEAYAVNLKHSDKAPDQVTRYTNFPFDQIVRYKNSYYGMNATGLYLLEGTTDDGDPIPWEVATHITDFGSPKLKTVERAYFGGRIGPDATVTLSVGEQADNSYSYTTPRGQTVQNYRQVFGKGAKARYFSIGVSGNDAFELDSLELAVTELTRRI